MLGVVTDPVVFVEPFGSKNDCTGGSNKGDAHPAPRYDPEYKIGFYVHLFSKMDLNFGLELASKLFQQTAWVAVQSNLSRSNIPYCLAPGTTPSYSKSANTKCTNSANRVAHKIVDVTLRLTSVVEYFGLRPL